MTGIPRSAVTVHGDTKTQVAVHLGVLWGVLEKLHPGPELQERAFEAIAEILLAVGVEMDEVTRTMALMRASARDA